MPEPDDKTEEKNEITMQIDGKDVTKTIEEVTEMAQASLKSDDDKSYTLKIDGVEQTFTMKELQQKASESAGAQKKFQDAHDLQERAASGMRIQELLTQMKGQETPDETKTQELMGLLGAGDVDIKAALAQAQKAPGTTKKEDKKPEPITMENLDPRTRAALEAAEQADLKQVREKIEGEAKKGVDNDKILGKIIDEAPGDTKGSLKNTLYEMVIDDVRGRILGREPYGPDMIQSSLQKVRARVKSFGTPTASAGQPPLVGELGIAAATSPEIRATEPIKRVSSANPGYEDNAVKRVQQFMVKAFSNSGKSL